MRLAVLSLTMVVLAGLAASPAMACRGPKTLFTDDFKQVDASWGLDTPDVAVEDGKVKVKAQPDIANLLIYKGILFTDADYCVKIRMPNVVSNSDNTMAGPVFWVTDYDNYYMFMITPSGYAEIVRKVRGQWIEVISWRQDTAINREAGKTNVVEVETRGGIITAYVNGQKFETVRGQMPEAGGQIGMRAQSEQDQVDTWKFSALKVTDLPSATDEAASAPPAPAPPAPATPVAGAAQAAGTASPAPKP